MRSKIFCYKESNSSELESPYSALIPLLLENTVKYPNVRILKLSKVSRLTPIEEPAGIDISWESISPTSAYDFSAVCWYFGQAMYDHLKIPIGLVASAVSGSLAQEWCSDDALSRCSNSALNWFPSLHWNAMLYPLLPLTVRDVLWYQGEANTGRYSLGYYACIIPSMIQDWRSKWWGNLRDVGFFYVQLAPWTRDNEAVALIRLEQLFTNEVPHTGFATAIDLGDPHSPHGDLHPRFKKQIGRRLSSSVRAISYGEDIPYLGPMATSWEVISNGTGSIAVVSFLKASVGSGLVFVEFPCPDTIDPNLCKEFEVEVVGHGWIPATGTIVEDSIHVQSSVENATMIGVRYGHSAYPIATLRNLEGFTGIPFIFPNPVRPVTCEDDLVVGCPTIHVAEYYNTLLIALIILLGSLFVIVIGLVIMWYKRKESQEFHQVQLELVSPQVDTTSDSELTGVDSSSDELDSL
eukprot:TRINITY_DN11186_c0_g1_i1.p1 TRINITY_DN11186_c0_g1~~TRINITY_DN11186_c0_g1_i1.p1  ORF type:complete len:465 (+),score=54.07 TRINITY_DN11186_c0_g1_i1:195-1589(+)